jgi:hypothetical protein
MSIKDLLFVTFLAGPILVLTFLAIYSEDRRPSPIRHENYDRIQVGMSRRQVFDLLGCGACTYENGRTIFTICDYKGPDPRGFWRDEKKEIHIEFVDDHVVGKSIKERVIDSEPWTDTVRRWVGLSGRNTSFATIEP